MSRRADVRPNLVDIRQHLCKLAQSSQEGLHVRVLQNNMAGRLGLLQGKNEQQQQVGNSGRRSRRRRAQVDPPGRPIASLLERKSRHCRLHRHHSSWPSFPTQSLQVPPAAVVAGGASWEACPSSSLTREQQAKPRQLLPFSANKKKEFSAWKSNPNQPTSHTPLRLTGIVSRNSRQQSSTTVRNARAWMVFFPGMGLSL